jgi:hypothetical protein
MRALPLLLPRFILLLTIILFLPFPAMATNGYVKQESGFTHEFWLYYLSVQHSLKGNVGEIRAAAELDHINPSATRFIAKFWWKKIQRQCVEGRPKSTVLISNQRDEVDIMQNVDEDLKYCAYDVLYKHWDDINHTILARLKTEHTDKRRAIMTSLATMGLSYNNR